MYRAFCGCKERCFISRRGIELEGSAYSDERYGISQIKDIEIEADDAKVEIKPSQDDTFGYSVTYEDTAHHRLRLTMGKSA